jgi:signal transduction histidine kinase
MMSHELRTPLNVVIGFAEILRTHGDHISTEKIVDYAGDVHEAATHLLNLINDVLDLSKAEAGKMELQRSAVDVADVIRRSLRMVQERAVRRRITLTDQIADGLPIIWADERKLMQILINLLSNAVKFTPDGGQVTIAARRADDESLIIEVVDTGIGIAPEHIDIALTAFGQIDSNLTRQQPGTGLGLPLAKRLTELHGATFDLRSQVGLGTTVSLRFPVVRAWATARI